MDLGLKGKRVLVTGGTKSIGRAIIDAFVAEGAVVAFCARDAALVKQREQEWRASQARVEGTALDVTNDVALKKWIDAFAAGGGIDHFVANVSALGTADSKEGWRQAIDVDIVSTVESVRHVWPHLLTSGARKESGGSTCTIIGTVSLVEATAGPIMPYRSVKAALVPFMKSLAIDGAPKNVRANMVSPGSIILMHDGGGDRSNTVAALPTIIKDLKAQGYDFATVGDLVVSDPPGPNDMSVDGKGVKE